jgi:hypothetical protein
VVEAARNHRPVAEAAVGRILRPVAAAVVEHIPRPVAAVVAAAEEADHPHSVAEAAANPTFVFSLRSAGCAGT